MDGWITLPGHDRRCDVLISLIRLLSSEATTLSFVRFLGKDGKEEGECFTFKADVEESRTEL